MDAPVLRARLLIVAALAAGCSDCGGVDPSRTVPAALDYLESTRDELGLDVVVALQIYATETGDERAERIAEARREGLRPRDLARYGVLLEIAKPAFPAGSLDGVDPGPIPPDPAADLQDDTVQRCPIEVLECHVDDACRGFAERDDMGGYVLTHQAIFVLFAHWSGCETAVDLEARRHTLGARLLAETRADLRPSELHGERLAMLGHLGFASAIEPAWWDTLRALQKDEGCFGVTPEAECHPHPTGVALWALAFAPQE